jgi:lysyl-tRNA synthetase class 2
MRAIEREQMAVHLQRAAFRFAEIEPALAKRPYGSDRGLVRSLGMRMVPVDSESLRAAGYDRARSVLRLRFRTGALYEYGDVPERVWQDLLGAESKGRYFMAHIRGRFPYHRVT